MLVEKDYLKVLFDSELSEFQEVMEGRQLPLNNLISLTLNDSKERNNFMTLLANKREEGKREAKRNFDKAEFTAADSVEAIMNELPRVFTQMFGFPDEGIIEQNRYAVVRDNPTKCGLICYTIRVSDKFFSFVLLPSTESLFKSDLHFIPREELGVSFPMLDEVFSPDYNSEIHAIIMYVEQNK